MIKKLLFITTILIAGVASAQSFQLLDHNDVDITGTNYTETGAAMTLSATKFHVKNTSGSSATYTCDVEEISTNTTSNVQICYGANCFIGIHAVTGIQIITGSSTVAAGGIDSTLKIAPFSFAWTGGETTTWRIRISNVNDASDSLNAVVTWTLSGVSIEELSSNNITLEAYPNPVSNNLNINYSIDGNTNNASLEVFDVVGQKVKSYTLVNNSDQLRIDVSGLNAGVYFYTIKVDNKTLKTERVIVK